MQSLSKNGSGRISPTDHLQVAASLLERYIEHERSNLRESQQDFRLSMAERSTQRIALLELALNLIVDEIPPAPKTSVDLVTLKA